jgi:hypothetical protein
MLAEELTFRNESQEIDGHLGSEIATTVAITNCPAWWSAQIINAFCFDSNGSELQISWRLRSAGTHASQGGIVSQHQLAKRDTLSR